MVAQFWKYITIALLILLSSCLMVGPDYKEPKKQAAQHWVHTDNSISEKPIKSATWWQVFHDPTLSCLINLGYHNNISLQAVATKVLKSRAKLALSVGDLYPQKQDMMGNVLYQRMGGQQFEFILPSTLTTAMLGVSANWELDFWGKYRRKILSDDALYLSSYAAYDNALVTLTSDIATTYISIRTTEELIRVTKENIQVQWLALNITKSRYYAGETNMLDYEFAKAEYYRTKATLPSYINTLQKQKDLLGVLLGTTPDNVDNLVAKSYGIPKPPKSVAVGIPREAIVHRPDIYEARLTAIAQLEGIGAVKANLFPALGLTGTFGFSSNDIGQSSLNQISNWVSRFALVGPSFAWPLLNYGQITNAVREQDAAYQESLLNYLNLVLVAQKEVQDNISSFIQSRKSTADLYIANNAAVKATKLSIIRYKEGESDFTPVLDAEREQLSIQTSYVTSQGDIPKAVVALYRSLGGGWQIRGCNDIVSNQVKDEMGNRTNWGNLLMQKNHQPPSTKQEELKELFLPNW